MNWARSLALLVAGALLGHELTVLFTPALGTGTIIILTLAWIFLGLYGAGAFDALPHEISLWRRRSHRLLPPKVGILNDMGWDSKDAEISAWSNVGPEEWKTEITAQAKQKGTKLQVELIKVEKNFDSFSAVLNPYGGVYPERNLKSFETLTKITRYVNEGGLFVNVSDLPSYWAYNLLLKRRLDTTPPMYNIKELPDGQIAYAPLRIFSRTPLMEQLGLEIRNVESIQAFGNWKVEFEKGFAKPSESGSEICVDRVVIVERNVRAVLKTKRIDGLHDDLTPLFFTNFGDGRFLFSLVLLGYQRPKNVVMRRILVEVLIEEIRNTHQRNGRGN